MLDLVGIPVLEHLRHQAINLVLQAGKDWRGAPETKGLSQKYTPQYECHAARAVTFMKETFIFKFFYVNRFSYFSTTTPHILVFYTLVHGSDYIISMRVRDPPPKKN